MGIRDLDWERGTWNGDVGKRKGRTTRLGGGPLTLQNSMRTPKCLG